jgi:hypothetical protein
MLKSILLQNEGLDNETLERVRHIDTTTRKRNSPSKTPGGNDFLAAVEESCESILDVSDLSFDETRDELAVNTSKHHLRASGGGGHNRSKRRSSGGPAQAAAAAVKRRKSRSLGAATAAHEEQMLLTATTKVTMDCDGVAHAESIIENVPVADLKKKARKSRESRGAVAAAAAAGGERRVTYSERNQEFSPTAPPYSEMMVTPTSSPLVRRNFSNASNIHHRPHIWQRMALTGGGRCGPCAKRIAFGKTRFVCKECHTVCHLDCRENVSAVVNALLLKLYYTNFT